MVPDNLYPMADNEEDEDGIISHRMNSLHESHGRGSLGRKAKEGKERPGKGWANPGTVFGLTRLVPVETQTLYPSKVCKSCYGLFLRNDGIYL